ncbi:STAS domain-containing protein [Comamonas composti]|uniref:STAS domain-containing protein n=1 Tax=Comamonas composti TaxID=408558 RepID=UPI00047CDD7A|nr:STAS domain-containing protein [Comamonas composti]
MAKEEDRKAGGLLSKVVSFVRHPTVNWSELDGLGQEEEGQYSKQALKEMMERKRRNDFVRKREFEQLRRIRQAQQQQAAAGPASGSQKPLSQQMINSLLSTSSGERAVTLKKIDEIEAQMSQQWWRGRPAGEVVTAPMSLPQGGNPMPESFRQQEAPPVLTEVVQAGKALQTMAHAGDASGFAPTQPFVPSTAFAPTQQLFAPTQPMGLGSKKPTSPAPAPLLESLDFGQPLAAASAESAESSQAPFVHDADLEEPAILFANGDVDSVEQILLKLIAERDIPSQLPIWLALLDLYRAADRLEAFDKAGVEFAARFGRSAPQWFAMPRLAPAPVARAGIPKQMRWSAPIQITVQTVVALLAAKSRMPGPWTLNWEHVQRIDTAAVKPLKDLFNQWADEQGIFIQLGAANLLAVLCEHSPSGEPEVDPLWWRLRLAWLRMLNQHDDFELAALDYCVTYEVSPPAWVDPLCRSFSEAQAAEAGLHESEQAQPGAASKGLSGVIEGDASAWLEPLQEKARLGEVVGIDCSQLVRLDFAAAGSVLNWAVNMQSQGHRLEFIQLHQLVAVFFNVIGIQEYARVAPRKD